MRGGVNEFLLDSRAPGGASTSSLNLKEDHGQKIPSTLSLRTDEHAYFAEEERKREQEAERQVAFLMEETRVWRVANSAQWVAWGIVQAKLPADCPSSGVVEEEVEVEVEVEVEMEVEEVVGNRENEGGGEEDAFDYLAYAKERALFFWGDVVSLGIVKKEELPGELVAALKVVEY
jgi:choline kinase